MYTWIQFLKGTESHATDESNPTSCTSLRSIPLVFPTGIGGPLLPHPPEGGPQGRQAPGVGHEVRRFRSSAMSSASCRDAGPGPGLIRRAADASESAEVRRSGACVDQLDLAVDLSVDSLALGPIRRAYKSA